MSCWLSFKESQKEKKRRKEFVRVLLSTQNEKIGKICCSSFPPAEINSRCRSVRSYNIRAVILQNLCTFVRTISICFTFALNFHALNVYVCTCTCTELLKCLNRPRNFWSEESKGVFPNEYYSNCFQTSSILLSGWSLLKSKRICWKISIN